MIEYLKIIKAYADQIKNKYSSKKLHRNNDISVYILKISVAFERIREHVFLKGKVLENSFQLQEKTDILGRGVSDLIKSWDRGAIHDREKVKEQWRSIDKFLQEIIKHNLHIVQVFSEKIIEWIPAELDQIKKDN